MAQDAQARLLQQLGDDAASLVGDGDLVAAARSSFEQVAPVQPIELLAELQRDADELASPSKSRGAAALPSGDDVQKMHREEERARNAAEHQAELELHAATRAITLAAALAESSARTRRKLAQCSAAEHWLSAQIRRRTRCCRACGCRSPRRHWTSSRASTR